MEDGSEATMMTEDERQAFEAYLPLKQRSEIRPASQAETDDKEDARVRKEIKLYCCTEEDGKLKISEVKTGPLLQSDLKSGDSFIVDNGNAGIWVWVGRKASKKERTEAMRNAQGFIKKKSKSYIDAVSRFRFEGFVCTQVGNRQVPSKNEIRSKLRFFTDYNAYTQVTRVVDQGEPAEFKALFKVWKDKDASTGFGKTYSC